MGFWGRIRKAVTRVFRAERKPSPPPTPPPVAAPDDSPDWGQPFSSSYDGWTSSNAGYDFSWSVAGWRPIGGEREDLEDEPNRILTDAELQNADYLVVRFSGAVGYKVIGGVWDDWEDLWHDVESFYDMYSD